MQKGLKLVGPMRAVAIAIGAAILTSVISMFVPVGVFETITGSTGISELIPATGAPLGDTARALIAFALGLVAFVVTAAVMLRKPAQGKPARANMARPEEAKVDVVDAAAAGPSFFESMKAKLADFAASRRGDNIVTELSDLPKLRAGDAHPDAPPRRPISAERDFAEISPPPPLAQDDEPVAPEVITADVNSVSHLVDQLEAAVSTRAEQLAKLETLAQAQVSQPMAEPIIAERVEAEVVAEPQPRLEAVPDMPAKAADSDEMDAALRSALETLHRMNGRTR